ncbi:MAG: hypothetical protein M3487_08750 [Actinomycetota bacterium]|nr:hypothetical protein [Acidimicrobiia bacterium]MDQ3469836.1 hypothetical protein [Actinomycetota bacterium]
MTLVEAVVGAPATDRTGDSVWFDVGVTEYWSLYTFEGGSEVFGYYSRVPS